MRFRLLEETECTPMLGSPFQYAAAVGASEAFVRIPKPGAASKAHWQLAMSSHTTWRARAESIIAAGDEYPRPDANPILAKRALFCAPPVVAYPGARHCGKPSLCPFCHGRRFAGEAFASIESVALRLRKSILNVGLWTYVEKAPPGLGESDFPILRLIHGEIIRVKSWFKDSKPFGLAHLITVLPFDPLNPEARKPGTWVLSRVLGSTSHRPDDPFERPPERSFVFSARDRSQRIPLAKFVGESFKYLLAPKLVNPIDVARAYSAVPFMQRLFFRYGSYARVMDQDEREAGFAAKEAKYGKAKKVQREAEP